MRWCDVLKSFMSYKEMNGECDMHMADALVNPAVAGIMYGASTAAAAVSVYKLNKEDYSKKIPVMGVMGAFVFATQMINFTIPGTGSSGHLCGGMLVSALLGPYAGFLTMIGVLLIQCLMFADGGLLAFGCNVWNMAFYGCFVGALLFWNLFMKKGFSKGKIIAASITGCVLTLQLGAFSVVLQTLLSGVTELPFTAFVTMMQPIHLAIGVVEGLITSAVLVFIYETRPELLYGYREEKENKLSFRAVLIVLLVLSFVIGGGLSLYASGNPDGLEWSMEKVAGTTELENNDDIHLAFSQAQEKTAILPDYSIGGEESAGGTSVSGVVGNLCVLIFAAVAALVFRFAGKKLRKDNE